MRMLCMLALFGFLQIIRGEENSVSSTTTNSAGDGAHPRIIKPLKSHARTDPDGRTMLKGELSENAKRVVLKSSIDTKTRPFGVYDRAVIAAVQNHWCELLDSAKYDGSSTGKVALQFQVYYDGRITGLKIIENTVKETLGLLCQKAVLELSPYPRWPKEMHKQLAADSRTLALTFYYLPADAHRKK